MQYELKKGYARSFSKAAGVTSAEEIKDAAKRLGDCNRGLTLKTTGQSDELVSPSMGLRRGFFLPKIIRELAC